MAVETYSVESGGTGREDYSVLAETTEKNKTTLDPITLAVTDSGVTQTFSPAISNLTVLNSGDEDAYINRNGDATVGTGKLAPDVSVIFSTEGITSFSAKTAAGKTTTIELWPNR